MMDRSVRVYWMPGVLKFKLRRTPYSRNAHLQDPAIHTVKTLNLDSNLFTFTLHLHYSHNFCMTLSYSDFSRNLWQGIQAVCDLALLRTSGSGSLFWMAVSHVLPKLAATATRSFCTRGSGPHTTGPSEGVLHVEIPRFMVCTSTPNHPGTSPFMTEH